MSLASLVSRRPAAVGDRVHQAIGDMQSDTDKGLVLEEVEETRDLRVLLRLEPPIPGYHLGFQLGRSRCLFGARVAVAVADAGARRRRRCRPGAVSRPNALTVGGLPRLEQAGQKRLDRCRFQWLS